MCWVDTERMLEISTEKKKNSESNKLNTNQLAIMDMYTFFASADDICELKEAFTWLFQLEDYNVQRNSNMYVNVCCWYHRQKG